MSNYGKHRIFSKVLFARVTSSRRSRTLTATPCNSDADSPAPRNDLRNALDTLNSGVHWQLVCRVSADQLALRYWLVKIYAGQPRERCCCMCIRVSEISEKKISPNNTAPVFIVRCDKNLLVQRNGYWLLTFSWRLRIFLLFQIIYVRVGKQFGIKCAFKLSILFERISKLDGTMNFILRFEDETENRIYIAAEYNRIVLKIYWNR